MTADMRITLKSSLHAYLISITSHVQHPQIVIYWVFAGWDLLERFSKRFTPTPTSGTSDSSKHHIRAIKIIATGLNWDTSNP